MSAAAASNNGHAAAIAGAVADELPIFAGSHRDKIAEWGLSAPTILEAGIRSSGDRGEIAALLNRKNVPSAWGACLIIPWRDESGAVVLTQVRPTHPPLKKGKPQKYLQPTGVAPPRLYMPPRTFPALADVTARLLITEGAPKALAAQQAGFPCVALAGVECWHPKNKVTLIPDLARIAWKGRPVFVAFDSDAEDNVNVARAESGLAAALQSHGALVKVVRIPPGAPAADGKPPKQGLDDFLVAHGAGEHPRANHAARQWPWPDG
jgi:putative DNA primase/helicase